MEKPYRKKKVTKVLPNKAKKGNHKIESFIHRLRSKYSRSLDTRQYLIKVHNFIKRLSKNQKNQRLKHDPYAYVRVCKACKDWKVKSQTLECFQCQDIYHITCITNQITEDDDWICTSCEKVCRDKYRYEEDIKTNRWYIRPQKYCKVCRRLVTEEDTCQCLLCKGPYHTKCFEQDCSGLVCKKCDIEIQSDVKKELDSYKEKSFDRIDSAQTSVSFSKKKSMKSTSSIQQQQLQITNSKILGFLPPPILMSRKIDKCRQSLLYAIASKSMKYTEELTYPPNLNSEIFNMDIQLQQIHPKDLQAFREYKRRPIGPYQVVSVSGLGYDVRSLQLIPQGTIICQYIGDVITRRSAIRRNVNNDSTMELLSSNDADSSLLIAPEHYTNIARFINGINNHKRQGNLKANVQSVRLLVDQVPKVILFAKRQIGKGQSLMYDYNAGGKGLFPTEQFL